ncbi:hypothetical protein [Acrocarpospora pleiomorpha]|uniref:hypothetical protein n=1 Tax=Acrocarpospora pleiomorpha TaxID=90975 RepID=UPI0012D2AE37|nr:hypothetical protein [Acrocarpospora pleiomorpha]
MLGFVLGAAGAAIWLALAIWLVRRTVGAAGAGADQWVAFVAGTVLLVGVPPAVWPWDERGAAVATGEP